MNTTLKDQLAAKKSQLAEKERFLVLQPNNWKLKVQRNALRDDIEMLIEKIQEKP